MFEETRHTEIKIPAYSEFVYGDIYNDEERTKELDSNFRSNIRQWGCRGKILNSLLKEISGGQRVLQMGVSFGDELEQLLRQVGIYGEVDVIDVNPLQNKLKEEKIKKSGINSGISFYIDDATTYKTDQPYDVVVCYFLLSELPIVSKMKVVNAALMAAKEGGKIIFVDAHNPFPWHPLRYFIRMYNRLYHPFVEKLWDREVETYAQNRTNYIWRTNTFFGGVFQKTVAIRKYALTEDELRASTGSFKSGAPRRVG